MYFASVNGIPCGSKNHFPVNDTVAATIARSSGEVNHTSVWRVMVFGVNPADALTPIPNYALAASAFPSAAPSTIPLMWAPTSRWRPSIRS